MVETASEQNLYIVVPCHNEEESLPAFHEATAKVESRLLDGWTTSVNYIFIDDGSTDATLTLLKQFHSEDARIHYLSFSRNFGKEAALIAGLEYALSLGAQYVAVMDADLQDPPELLPTLFERMHASDCEIVATYRESRTGEPVLRSWFAHRFYHLMNAFSSVEMRDGARDFRLMTRKVVEAICALPERARFSKGIFVWVGFSTEWVGYENIEREHGETSWSFWSLTHYAIDGIIAFSEAPLEAISISGLILFLLAIIFLIFIVVRAALFGDPVAGWPSLVCIITLLSGLQLFGMGILGLYLSKVYVEVKGRPTYVIAERA